MYSGVGIISVRRVAWQCADGHRGIIHTLNDHWITVDTEIKPSSGYIGRSGVRRLIGQGFHDWQGWSAASLS